MLFDYLVLVLEVPFYVFPPGSKNKPKQNVPTEPAAPKRKPKPPPLETAPAEAPAPVEALAEAPAASAHKRAAARPAHAGEAVGL